MKIIASLAMTSILVLTGCNTVQGFGKDVSKVGEVVTGTAEKTQEKL